MIVGYADQEDDMIYTKTCDECQHDHGTTTMDTISGCVEVCDDCGAECRSPEWDGIGTMPELPPAGDAWKPLRQ